MDLVHFVLTIINLVMSFYMVRRGFAPRIYHLEPTVLAPLDEGPLEDEPILGSVIPMPERREPLAEPKESPPEVSYSAWRNVKEEPISVPPSPSPHRPAPTSGPLQRPYGFPG